MAILEKDILGPENGILINDLNLAGATADKKSVILKNGNGIAHPVLLHLQIEWKNLNVTTDVVRVYQKIRKDSSVAAQVEDTTIHILTLNSANGNAFIKVFPTGAEYFKVAIEGAVLGSNPTATVGTISIDYAAKQ